MDNKGWGLAEMLILCSILVVSLLMASFYIRSLSKTLDVQKGHNNTTNVEHTNKDNNTLETNEKIQNSDDKIYINIENKIELLSQRYIYNIYNNEIDETTIIVDMKHLLEHDYEKELETLISQYSCNGYSKVYKNETKIYYDSYIKCDEYTTIGFEEFYIE